MPHAFTFFSVVKIESDVKLQGVTIKFFFNYKSADGAVEEDSGDDDGNFVTKLYDNLLAQAMEPSRREAMRSASKLAFIPRVASLTSGDDLARRVFWEEENVNIRLNKRDPWLCPEGGAKYENCQSLEIWMPEMSADGNDEFVLLLNDSRAKNFNKADGAGTKVGVRVTTGTLPFS